MTIMLILGLGFQSVGLMKGKMSDTTETARCKKYSVICTPYIVCFHTHAL